MTPPRSTGDYRHDEKRRKNNPPVGMVTYDVKIAEQPPAHYGYDPHLSPQLIWAGKPGLVNVEVEDAAGLAVDTISLHIHERVSTQAIIHAVQKPQTVQLDLFAGPRQPLQQAVEFYQHDVDWANRLILGDSLLVMNSVEAIPPAELASSDTDTDALASVSVSEDANSLIRQDGVHFPDNRRLRFTSLTPLTGSVLHMSMASGI